MNEKMQLISKRVKEMREILDISLEDMSEATAIPIATYKQYENAEADMPISALYSIAAELEVDPTELLIGEAPKMTTYTVVRGEQGVAIERYEGYSFTSLATNYKNRDMEPMIVYLSKSNDKPQLVSHLGQEFNYCLEGKIAVHIGNKIIELSEKDSIYFDATIPHGQVGITEKARFLTILNEYEMNKRLIKK